MVLLQHLLLLYSVPSKNAFLGPKLILEKGLLLTKCKPAKRFSLRRVTSKEAQPHEMLPSKAFKCVQFRVRTLFLCKPAKRLSLPKIHFKSGPPHEMLASKAFQPPKGHSQEPPTRERQAGEAFQLPSGHSQGPPYSRNASQQSVSASQGSPAVTGCTAIVGEKSRSKVCSVPE